MTWSILTKEVLFDRHLGRQLQWRKQLFTQRLGDRERSLKAGLIRNQLVELVSVQKRRVVIVVVGFELLVALGHNIVLDRRSQLDDAILIVELHRRS